MTTLSRKVKDQIDQLEKLKSICSDLIIQKDWYEVLNDQIAQNLLVFTNLIKISNLSPKHNKIKIICIFKKNK